MRLYSKRQLIVISAGVFAVALLLGAGLGFLRFPQAAQAAVSAGTTATATERTSPSIALSVNPGTQAVQVQNDVQGAYTLDEQENIAVYERFNEAVVNITTEVVAVNWYLEPVPQEGGSGSGSIIDTRGYVLTNNHVVKDAYKVYVNLADGTRYPGKVRGVDAENDLAVVEFAPPKGQTLKTIPFGDSGRLKVGQKVLAIGNPFALERTLTRGIVSGLGRPVKSGTNTVIQNMIQTDASINPGNSGGPLLNSRGEMIGINTMIYSPSGGSVGIGFAVPVNTAKRVVSDLIQYGMVKRGWIDVTPVQLFPELVDYMKANRYSTGTDRGLLLSAVKAGGNADRAGLKGGSDAVRYGRSVLYLGGDILVKVDGADTPTLADFYAALEDNKPGDRVEVEYMRGKNLVKATVTLSDRAQVLKEE